MEEIVHKRPSRTRRAPAGLSDYDTPREDPADPQIRISNPASTPTPARGGAGERARSPKRQKSRLEDARALSNSPSASSIPGASDTTNPEAEIETEEDSGAQDAQEEASSGGEDKIIGAEPSALMQLPQEMLAKILGALPSHYLIQASGVCFLFRHRHLSLDSVS